MSQFGRSTRLPDPLRGFWERYQQRRHWRVWLASGRPAGAVPHVVKQQCILDYARSAGIRVLVETGTYLGSMVYAMRRRFDRIFSIELSADLFELARRRFRSDPHIRLFQGDSGSVLPEVLKQLDEPAVFWLDGHYSGGITARTMEDTPILQELQHIFAHRQKGHVILIDDAREFVGANGYPTLEMLRDFVAQRGMGRTMEVRDDIIRITPASAA